MGHTQRLLNLKQLRVVLVLPATRRQIAGCETNFSNSACVRPDVSPSLFEDDLFYVHTNKPLQYDKYPI
jgi:hypothetical protein